MKYIKIILLLIVVAITFIGGQVKAVTTNVIDLSKKASLTITKYEHANGSTNNVPLKGVEFTVYSIPNNIETVSNAESYVKNNQVTSVSKTTGEDGTVKFSNLELGRYLVAETKAPKNVTTKIESFLIDLPRTTNDGKSWNYDVTVYPKNITIYGKVTLTHSTMEGENLTGTTWKLEKKDKDGNWQEYEGIGTLTTDENGKITIENLEKGNYRLVPQSTVDSYILDQTDAIKFTIDDKNTNYNLRATSEKLNVEKYVILSDGSYGKYVGAYTTDKTSWMVEADVTTKLSRMKDYIVTENFPQGISYKEGSLSIYGDDGNGKQTKLPTTAYEVNIQNQKMTINFNPNSLTTYKKVVIFYDTEFDYKNVKSGNFESKTSLEYTDYIDIKGESKRTFKTADKSANVYTASVLILKTNTEGAALQGAQFKIATSKQNAENGVFIKDDSNNDVIATSDANGYIVFYGLKIGQDDQAYSQAQGSYWIVEVQAPSYEEDGETKYYNLLDKSVEVQVSSLSGTYSNDTTTKVVNKKGFKLPVTGGNLNIIPIVAGLIIICVATIMRKKNKKDEKEVETE